MGQGRRRTYAVVLGVLLSLSGCAYYSFTGASIEPHLETVAIPLFADRSVGGPANMDSDLTELLIDRFVRQTRLDLASDPEGASAVLTGVIEAFRNEPVAVTGEEQASLNRVTLRVAVRYVDQVEDEELLNTTLTQSAEYDPVADGLAGEAEAALAALEKIADEVFTRATSGW